MIDPHDYPELPELMIVGPGEMHEEDLAVLGHQVVPHFAEPWMTFHAQLLDQVGEILGTAEAPYLIPGTGTTCLDAAVMNLFEPGQRVVVPNTGFFGHRLIEIATQQGLDVDVVDVEMGQPIDAGVIADRLAGVDGVLSVHVDTSTGVAHPIEDIARACREEGVAYLVDGIASVGGEPVRVDDWGISVMVTGTQKGFEAPPGLGIIGVGPSGRERIDARGPVPSWYLDLARWDWYRREWPHHPHPVTFPTQLSLALGSSLNRILRTGLDEWIRRRHALADRLREGLEKAGFGSVPAPGFGASLVVAMWADDPAAVQQHLATRGLLVAGGLAPLAGRTFRVGLIGRTATDAAVDKLLEAIAELP